MVLTHGAGQNHLLTKESIKGVVAMDIPYIAYPTIYLTEFLNGDR